MLTQGPEGRWRRGWVTIGSDSNAYRALSRRRPEREISKQLMQRKFQSVHVTNFQSPFKAELLMSGLLC